MLSKAGVPTSGVRQVETATAAGTLSGASGDVSVIVTAAGLTGSPLTVLVPTTTGDTAAVWAGKVRTVLAADAAIAAFFLLGLQTPRTSQSRTPFMPSMWNLALKPEPMNPMPSRSFDFFTRIICRFG